MLHHRANNRTVLCPDGLESRTLLTGGGPGGGAHLGAIIEQLPNHPGVEWEPGQNISDQQKENIKQLLQDLERLKEESEVTDEQKEALVDSFVAVFDDATRPDSETVVEFATSLQDALEDGEVSLSEYRDLKEDFNAILESANISPDEVKGFVNALQDVIDSSNVDRDDLEVIASDLAAIREEFQENRRR